MRNFIFIVEKILQVSFVANFKSVSCPNAVIRFNYHGITDFRNKIFCRVNRGNLVKAGSWYIRRRVIFFHCRFIFYSADIFKLFSRRNVKICSQFCILFQPKFVVGFKPINFPVLETEKCNRLKNFFVVLQIFQKIIFRQRFFQLFAQIFKRRVTNSQNVDAVFVQPVAELPIMFRKIRRYKNKIHHCASFKNSGRKYKICFFHQYQS